MPLDLFQLAADNGPALEARFQSQLAGLNRTDGDAFSGFAEHIRDDGQISLNLGLMNLRNALEDQRFHNLYDVALRRAQYSSSTEAEIRERENPKYHARREALRHAVQDEDQFVYGALNSGGLGASGYGEFCVVLSPTQLEAAARRLAYLGGDSLTTYVDSSGAVDTAGLATDCSADSHKHHLCALKHSSAIPACAQGDWPALHCSRDAYIEVVMHGPVTTTHVTAIRVSKSDFELYFDFAFDQRRRDLTGSDRYQANDFERIYDRAAQDGISWEVLPDA